MEAKGGGLRVLFLATYFPKPANPIMGTWALAQARAFVEAGIDLRTVSFTSYVPRWIGRLGVKPAWALCPRRHVWEGGVRVEYPRWAAYHTGSVQPAYRDPRPWAPLYWLSARRALRRIVAEHQPQVLFCHHTLFNGYLACRLRRETGLPYVTTDHDFQEVADCARYPGRRALMDRVAADAFRSVAVATRMEADMRRLLPSSRPCTVHNGAPAVPDALLRTPRPAALQNRLLVTSIGIFNARKGIPLLVRAFARAAASRPGALLRLIGDGADRPNVEDAIRESGLGPDQVELLGTKSHADAMQNLAWTDIFASIGWEEPFATVLLEAAAAGKPSLWAADGGINDVLRDSVHGLAVEPRSVESAAQALDHLLSSPDERTRMGRAAAELHRTSLSWDANVRAMKEIFAAAVAGGPAPHAG